MDLWYSNRRFAGEVRGEALRIAGLRKIVELRAHLGRELLSQARDVVCLRGGPMATCARCAVLEDLEVELDLLDDPGPSHLYDHLAPVAKGRSVRLADRSRRQGSRLERRERALDLPLKLALHGLADGIERDGGSGVLQLRELVPVNLRQQVPPRREPLADLDERRAEFRECRAQVLGWCRERPGRLAPTEPRLGRHETPEAEDVREVHEPVTEQDLRDFALPVAYRLMSVSFLYAPHLETSSSDRVCRHPTFSVIRPAECRRVRWRGNRRRERARRNESRV